MADLRRRNQGIPEEIKKDDDSFSFSKLDMYTKIDDEFKVKTSSGAFCI